MIDPKDLPNHEPDNPENDPLSEDSLGTDGLDGMEDIQDGFGDDETFGQDTAEPDETDQGDTEQNDPAQAKIEALQAELDQTKEQLLRTAAELENTRRRAQKERADASKFGIAGFARDMLSVADNLTRALSAVPEEAKADQHIKNLVEGLEATERELQRGLEKNDIKKVDPQGKIFDPNYHEVMFETPGTGQPAGSIIQVLEVGYMIGERLLRPARVGVAKDEGQSGSGNGGGGPSTDPGAQIDTEA